MCGDVYLKIVNYGVHNERPGSEWMHEPPEVESLVARCALACRDMEAGEGSNEIVEHPHVVLQIV